MPQYQRPPITEAVIELRFEQANKDDVLDQYKRRMSDEYPVSEEGATLQLSMDLRDMKMHAGKARVAAKTYKLTRGDGAALLLISPQSVGFIQLAPYTDWTDFRANSQRLWGEWKRIAGYRKLSRVGLRYVNRIDVPDESDGKIEPEEYLLFAPQLPSFEPPWTPFSYETVVRGPFSDSCNVLLRSGIVPPAIVKHFSLLLDIDVSRDSDVPQNDDEMWTVLDSMRDIKNMIFEGSITDSARRLFD